MWDHLDIARRAAPRTSLPILICDPGEVSDVDKAIAIFRPAHLIWIFPDESVSCTVYGRTGIVEPRSKEKRMAKVAGRRIVARETNQEYQQEPGVVLTEAHGSTLQGSANHIFERGSAASLPYWILPDGRGWTET